MQVSDNGRGISQDDLSLVGERYSTSKCHNLADLQQPHYFGFRGEALASIVQVARTVELTSRHYLSQLTYYKVFQDGHNMGIVPSSQQFSKAGTTVTVHNLFYNYPVRQRHMGPSLLMETMKNTLCKALLVLPHVSLSLLDQQAGQRLLQVSRAGSLMSRLHQLFGRVKGLGIQERSVENAGVRISALLSVAALNSRHLQLVFVNRRLVESDSFHELVSRLLEPIVSQSKPKTQYPFYIIIIEGTVDLDVWLHPTKPHIHFEQEESVYTALTCLIGSFLSENHFTVAHPPPPVAPSRKTQPQQTSVPAQSSPPVCQPVSQSPTTWRAAVDPATNLLLLVHPVSGCTHTTGSRTPQPCSSRPTRMTMCRSDSLSSSHMDSAIKGMTCVRVQSAMTSAQGAGSLLSGWRNPTFSAGDQVCASCCVLLPTSSSSLGCSDCGHSQGSLSVQVL